MFGLTKPLLLICRLVLLFLLTITLVSLHWLLVTMSWLFWFVALPVSPLHL